MEKGKQLPWVWIGLITHYELLTASAGVDPEHQNAQVDRPIRSVQQEQLAPRLLQQGGLVLQMDTVKNVIEDKLKKK